MDAVLQEAHSLLTPLGSRIEQPPPLSDFDTVQHGSSMKVIASSLFLYVCMLKGIYSLCVSGCDWTCRMIVRGVVYFLLLETMHSLVIAEEVVTSKGSRFDC